MPSTTAPIVVRDAATPKAAARQFIRFAFYRVDPAWRRLPEAEREAGRAALANLCDDFSAREGVILRTYSLVGTRGDADFMIWLVAEDLDVFHEFSSRLNRSPMGGYLTSPYHYFSMTKRSMYVENHSHAGQEGRRARLILSPTDRKYLFVYPFVKTRAWYRLSADERQRQMSEHIAMGHRYPEIKINTTYSFGLDDQEFVVAFEGDSVADFLDLVHEMRESEASAYTVRDVPSFTCMLKSPRAIADALG